MSTENKLLSDNSSLTNELSQTKRKYVPVEVAKKIGTTAAMLLQHIQFWMQSQSVEILYRTNAQLASDFNLMFSESQIQYAKKKLIDSGYIIVTKPNKYDRTTHYQLTDLSKKLLGVVEVVKEKVVEKVSEVVDTLKDTFSKKQPKKSDVKKETVVKTSRIEHSSGNLANTKAMQESFNEGFTNKKAVPMPKDLLAKMREKMRGSSVSHSGCDDNSDLGGRNSASKHPNLNDSGLVGTNIPDQDLNQNTDVIVSNTQHGRGGLSGILGSVFSIPPNLEASKQRMYNEEIERSYREE